MRDPSPTACHLAPSFLALQDLDDGKLPQWTSLQAPDIGKNYWKLAPDATMRDLLLAIRADEACHMCVVFRTGTGSYGV